MNEKEKAEELLDSYLNELNQIDSLLLLSQKTFTAKQCALICVDEILQSHYVVAVGIKSSLYNYWEEVKKEIEAL